MSGEREQPRLLRPRDGRIVLGVCAALARAIRTDVAVVRAAFGVPVLLGALGALAWLPCCETCVATCCPALRCALLVVGAVAVGGYLLASALIPNE